MVDGARTCEIDLLKEGVGDPVVLGIGTVLNRDDAVGLKVGALHDRAAHRDFVDIHAAHTRGGYVRLDVAVFRGDVWGTEGTRAARWLKIR